jgi:hypothetical protein
MAKSWAELYADNPTTTFNSVDIGCITQDAITPSGYASFGYRMADLIPFSAKGDLYCCSDSDGNNFTPAVLPIGVSDGMVLQVNSAADTGMSWQTPSGVGALIPLSQQVVDSPVASVDFISLITATYNTYYLTVYNAYPTTNTSLLNMNLSTDNGATYITTNYRGTIAYVPYNGTTWLSSNLLTAMRISPGMTNNVSNPGACGFFNLYNFNNGKMPCSIGEMCCHGTTSNLLIGGPEFSVQLTAVNINAFQIIASAGTIARGTFTLYGVLET